jgi:predicted acylesterase/phospholipase RssA
VEREQGRSLPGFEDRAERDRYCDLVLTGGVTSAIAYPGVIHGLAQVYRFNAIGGSSSGAGSAALAAAAEYRRRHGSSEGFRTLLRRTAEVKDHYRGQDGPAKTGLAWLFQPEPGKRTWWGRAWLFPADGACERLFTALVPVFAGPTQRKRRAAAGLARAYARPLLLGVLLACGSLFALGALAGAAMGWGLFFAVLVPGALLALVVTARLVLDDLEIAADNDYGLCSGQRQQPGAPHEPLTPWLHALLQDIAGLPLDRPLTFADLHAAPAGPSETLADASAAGQRSIDLRMVAANVTLGRPLLLPQGEDEAPFYFRPREMRRLFPEEVVSAMMRSAGAARCSVADVLEPRRASAAPLGDTDEDRLWELPRERLPVIVAARMSVSFPVLFSAVPLWQQEAVPGGPPRLRRLLVSDGGLCSGFPIHLFDSPIPAWPTFGVALRDSGGPYSMQPRDIAARVHVPLHHLDTWADRASRFDSQAKPLQRVGGFALAVLATVKDWNDTLLAELPGVRERVAEVALPDNIGGLNILMTAEQIECLALLGGEVARQLLQRYAVPDGSGAHAPGWREHRWVRFNVLSECLLGSLVGLSKAAQHARYAEPLREQIRRAAETPPLAGAADPALQPAQAAALERTLDALLQIERALTPRPLAQPYRPMPRPELRIRPPM